MSDVTKKYTRLIYIFFWLGVLLTFLPLLIFGVICCMKGTIDITNKLKLGVCFVTALMLTVMGIKSKYNCRSITYLLLFGCYYVIQDIKWVIFVAGICCILDEFVCRPLHKRYREKSVINKEIDKRYDNVQQREEQEN